MREQSDQMRQATTAKVCLDLAKSGRFTVPVLSTAGFNRPLLALSTICRCPSRSKERSCPRNRGNLANVGLMADDLKISHPHPHPRPPRPKPPWLPWPPWPAPCRCPRTDRAFAPDLLDVVAVYDNPLHWSSRYANFLRFEDNMIEAGVRLTTVETAYGQMPFDLADREGVRRVRLRPNSIC
jgi:hypothetical protein